MRALGHLGWAQHGVPCSLGNVSHCLPALSGSYCVALDFGWFSVFCFVTTQPKIDIKYRDIEGVWLFFPLFSFRFILVKVRFASSYG